MTTSKRSFGVLIQPVTVMARWLNWLQPLFGLSTRIWVGLQFWKSGLVKVESWDTTLYLFREEYHVPVLPPELAAIAGTFGELFFPPLLWFGFYTRFGALGASVVNVVAVISYAHVLLAPGFEGAIAQHILWGFMLGMLAIYGPGSWSVDALLARWAGKEPV